MEKMRQTLMFLITTWGAEKDDTAHTTTLNVKEEVDILLFHSCHGACVLIHQLHPGRNSCVLFKVLPIPCKDTML